MCKRVIVILDNFDIFWFYVIIKFNVRHVSIFNTQCVGLNLYFHVISTKCTIFTENGKGAFKYSNFTYKTQNIYLKKNVTVLLFDTKNAVKRPK